MSMRRLHLVWLSLVAAALCAPAPAVASSRPITGKLSKPGYTIIAVGYNGTTSSTRSRSFRLVPRASRVTLQLRDPKGRYGGPVVVGGTAKKVVVGVRAGAKLGTIKVERGYAKVTRAPRKAIDRHRTAVAKRGVPLGNGRNFGLVPSKARGGSGDRDGDAVPDALDVDANGDRILDKEQGAVARRAVAAQVQPVSFSVFSQLNQPLERSVNADAAGVTDADINSMMQGNTTAPPFQPIGTFLVFQFPSAAGATLDCGGLSYCSPGGTGRVRAPGGMDPGPSFTGTLTPDSTPSPNGVPGMTLYPMATSAQMNTGDVLIERTPTGETPATLGFVFNTTPALTAWSSSGGQSGSVAYPVAVGAPGTQQNPFVVSPGPDGEVTLNLTAFRPQRKAIPGAGEGSGYMDIGKLLWQARLINQPAPGTPQRVIDCHAGYSTTDPQLTPTGDGLQDTAADAPANPANKLSYSLNATGCLGGDASWTSGQTMQLELVARATGGDNSSQQVYFRLA
jgi:hypothetical protein